MCYTLHFVPLRSVTPPVLRVESYWLFVVSASGYAALLNPNNPVLFHPSIFPFFSFSLPQLFLFYPLFFSIRPLFLRLYLPRIHPLYLHPARSPNKASKLSRRGEHQCTFRANSTGIPGEFIVRDTIISSCIPGTRSSPLAASYRYHLGTSASVIVDAHPPRIRVPKSMVSNIVQVRIEKRNAIFRFSLNNSSSVAQLYG